MINWIRTLFSQWLQRRLFRWRDAEPGEVCLNQRRVFILPTRAGLVCAVLLIVLFIACVNYNLSLGYVLTFLLAGCALIDMHLSFRNLAHLYLSPGRAQPVFSGEEAQFEFQIANRSNHPRYAIWLGFIGEGISAIEQAVDVGAQTSCTVKLAITSTQRGWLPAPRVRLQTWFPLGWLRTWGYWHPDVKVLVYPRPEDNAPALPMTNQDAGEGQEYAGQEDFAGIRAYQAGDSMKHLAWRQIAKMDAQSNGALVSKHFEGGAAEDICLDLNQLPRGMNIETKLSRMTRWVLEAEQRSIAYAFRAGAAVFPAALGPAHQEACLRALALYPENQ